MMDKIEMADDEAVGASRLYATRRIESELDDSSFSASFVQSLLARLDAEIKRADEAEALVDSWKYLIESRSGEAIWTHASRMWNASHNEDSFEACLNTAKAHYAAFTAAMSAEKGARDEQP